MAEVDPLTGSPLSRENRNSFFRSSTVPSSAFRGTDVGFKTQVAEQSKKFAEAQQQNQTVLTGIQQQFQNLQNQINTLSQSINNIYKLIQADTNSEQQLLAKEQQQEVKSNQRQIRVGGENQLEQKIQRALAAPVEALTNKVENIFGRVGSALSSLFLGWLGIQGIKTLNAWRNKDNDALNDIKNDLLKNIGIGVGAIASIHFGLRLVKNALLGVTRGVTSLIFNAIKLPFKAAGAAAAGLGGVLGLGGGKGAAPPAASTGAKPAARGPGLLGGLSSAFGAGMNLKSGEFADAALNTAGFIPGPIGAAARATAFVDEMVESFAPSFREGAGIIGSAPRGGEKKDQPQAQVSQPQQTKIPELKPSPAPEASKPSENKPPNLLNAEVTAEKKAPAEVTPESPMVPNQEPPVTIVDEVASRNKENAEPQKPMMPTSTDLTLNINKPKTEKEKDYYKSQQDRWNNILKGLQSGATYEELGLNQKEIDYLDGKTDKLPFLMEENKPQDVSSQIVAQPEMIETKPPTAPAIQPPKEPAPNVIVASAPQQGKMEVPGPTTTTDVPLIPSANPDNFYVLYSQLNYNVVM